MDHLNKDRELIKEWISIGYRCTSASLLKKIGLKNASYPFDWMISRPSVVKHAIINNFQEFMKLSNYQSYHTNTYKQIFQTSGLVCDESIFSNQFYKLTPFPNNDSITSDLHFYTPLSDVDLSNTYHHGCALNHYNFNQRPAHYNYYLRSIQRFREKITSSDDSLYFLYISPVYPLSLYDTIHQPQIHEIASLFSSLETLQNVKGGIVFLLYHSDKEDPTFYEKQSITSIKNKQISIYRIDCNQYLIDAGESFMGNFHREEKYMCEIIKNTNSPLYF